MFEAGLDGAIPAPGRLRQENCKFKASLGTLENLVTKKEKRKEKN
jgi:hypothetical protein